MRKRVLLVSLVAVLALPACAGYVSDCAKLQLAVQLACSAEPQGPTCSEARKMAAAKCGVVEEPPVVTCPDGFPPYNGKCPPDDPKPPTPPPPTPPPTTPPPAPPPTTPPPTPPASYLVYPIDEGYGLDVNCRKYGNGIDCTLWVTNAPLFCEAVHGKAVRDCHLEGHPNRLLAELELLKGKCYTFRYRSGAEEGVCHDDRVSAAVSCDHFGLADGSYRDDPNTPAFEGVPQCAAQRDEFGPNAGFWVMPQCTPGRECAVQACIPGGKCSAFVIVDWK